MKDAASPSFGNIDRLLEEIGNKYLLVNVARVRAQQLVNGIEPLVEGANPEKAVTTAFSEIRTGKLDIEMDTTPQGNGRRG
ncbi:MAG TPA: DNA-directed RNA polymerase subunit omega [Candidatus Eremiobacteraceae bacterium]|nr:DNA-directed RNA polymerase subunit omega [Candidatus Eremiobacteraceae bacterium]